MGIVMDRNYRELEKARKLYRRRWNRGYLMQQRGDHDGGQRVLDKANAELREAEARYPVTRR